MTFSTLQAASFQQESDQRNLELATMMDRSINHHNDEENPGVESDADESCSSGTSISKHLGDSVGDTTSKTGVSSTTDKEIEAVNRSKYIVVFLLALAGVGAGCLTFFLVRDSEQDAFEQQVEAQVHEIEDSLRIKMSHAHLAMENLATSITSAAIVAEAEWPMFTMPFFEKRAEEVLDVSDALGVGWAPLVFEGTRTAYEEYAVQNQGWIAEGIAYSQDSYYKNQPATPSQEQLIPGRIHTNAMITAGDDVDVDVVFPTDKQGPFLPIAQIAPAPRDPSIVNFDLLSDDVTNGLLFGMAGSMGLTISGILPSQYPFIRNQEPHSLLLQPILATFGKKKPTPMDLVGTLVVILHWGHRFQHLLAPGTPRVDLVMSDTCGDTFTYQIEGTRAIFVSYDDVHNEKYDHLGKSTVLDELVARQNSTMRDGYSCEYVMSIYPSAELEQQYTTSKPWIYAFLVALIFVLFAILFIIYDVSVQRRQDKVMATAARSTAIVASLFPSNVRDRILKDAEGQANLKAQQRKSGGSSTFGVAQRNQLKSFLDDGAVKESDFDKRDDSKPIADLFPSTTVMFGDIAGFTAWSSVREPCQVFLLLETLYNAFDEIALRRRVFKVETIGDCYVAVCGLPEPRKDHATVMARFARDLLGTMKTLTRKLEMTLGPDTGDLGLRIGLHSGPVTAGVLRGQNCRFQLFGDTVNTAARMESNGKRDAIHMSEGTATLLNKSGKEHWVVQREDRIVAKGKGEMTTFWLDLKTKRRQSATPSSNGSESGASRSFGSLTDQESLSSAGNGALPRKLKRLATWNTEVLFRLLKAVVARRDAEDAVQNRGLKMAVKFNTPSDAPMESSSAFEGKLMVVDEVKDVITLPKFNAKAAMNQADPKSIELNPLVLKQLHEYVTVLASMYRREVPFHNFEHASHVTQSVTKLLSRIVAPDSILCAQDDSSQDDLVKQLHEHTYGITSDPMTQFAVVLSALIHDVDHQGVPNQQLISESSELADLYQNKSVAEQNSVDIAWDLLMDDGFKDLRAVIYTTELERKRFRQLIVNTVMATDICDKDLKNLRNARWQKAFDEHRVVSNSEEAQEEDINRRATIVIEHLIQASDVAHTMQHWHIYRKWNEKFFHENMLAFRAGRSDKNPAEYWYKGEIGFFDFYIIPLAKKLKECGVFGVSSDEYLNYAENNRKEWIARGQEVVDEMAEKYPPVLNTADFDLVCLDEGDEEEEQTCTTNSALELPQETIFEVSECWELLRRIPNYEESAGTILFQHLFTKCPPAKVLFGFPIAMDPRSSQMKSSKRFLQHAGYMIQMLDKALQLIGPDVETLAKILADLGRQHVHLGVKEDFFPVMGDALQETLSELLSDKFTDELAESWKEVYGALSRTMINAMNNEKAVLRSWQKLKRMDNFQEVAGSILFQRLFQLCPETKVMFGMPLDMDVSSAIDSKKFKTHVGYFVDMLDKALQMVQAKTLGENMERLGKLHASLGVKEEYFEFMGDALIHMLKELLKNEWNKELKEAWEIVYGRLSSQMITAMNKEKAVLSSWSKLKQIDNYQEVAGSILFARFFQLCPETKSLFGLPADVNIKSQGMLKSKKFKSIVANFINMLDVALEMVRSDQVGQNMERLGKLHASFGVKEEYFPLMGDALFHTLKVLLKDDFDEASEGAWAHVYNKLSSQMIAAMNTEKAVLRSWNKLKQLSNYQEVAGVVLFQRLFQLCPEAKTLFGLPADLDVSSQSMLQSRRFKTHAAYFIEMLDKALEMVRAEQLGENMARLGKMHASFGVKAEYFPLMGDALFHMLKELLKKDFDEASEHAWIIVYGRLSSQMIAAMNTEVDVLASWGKLKQMDNYQEVAGTILFQRLFQLCPETKLLFGLPANLNIHSQEMLESKKFKSVVANFINMLDVALEMVKADQVGENMERLGKLHASFGVKAEYFPLMGDALFHTLKMLLKKDWNDDLEGAWTVVFNKLSSQMITAMNKEKAVLASWSKLKLINNYQEVAGSILFARFFQLCPETKKLFGLPLDLDVKSPTMLKSRKFKSVVANFVNMLDVALEMVRAEEVGENMERLGKMHASFGVKVEYFPMMGDALLYTLKEVLKNDFDEVTERAWSNVYGKLSSQMITAMNTEKAVLSSWSQLKEIENYQEVAGSLLFQSLFEDCPETKTLFGLPADMDVLSMLGSARFKTHAAYFVEMLDKALEMVRMEQVGENMARLGRMHAAYGVKAEYFKHMGDALFKVLRQLLMSDFDEVTEQAWTVVYGRLSTQMITAIEKETSGGDPLPSFV